MLVSSKHGTIQKNTTKCPVTFYLVHTTIPNYYRVTGTLAYTRGGHFKPFGKVNQTFKCFCCFFSIHHTKGKPSGGAKLCTYRCVPRRANSLLRRVVTYLMSMDTAYRATNPVAYPGWHTPGVQTEDAVLAPPGKLRNGAPRRRC